MGCVSCVSVILLLIVTIGCMEQQGSSFFPDSDILDVLEYEIPRRIGFLGALHGRGKRDSRKPWWNGPNVCLDFVEDSREGGGIVCAFGFDCPTFHRGDIFGNDFRDRRSFPYELFYHRCCNGYIRRMDGKPGCVKPLTILKIMEGLETDLFSQWIDSAGLRQKLITGTVTVFAPSNEAIKEYSDEIDQNAILHMDTENRLPDASSLVRRHIATGFQNLDNLENEQLIDTLNGDVKIRINKYRHAQKELVTSNCIPVIWMNDLATNGMVNMVSGVLPEPKQSLGDIIENDSVFSTLRRLLKRNGLMEALKKTDISWTLFAPTDDAFRNLSLSLRNGIDSGDTCAAHVLRQHFVKGTVCTSAVIDQMKVKNVLDNFLTITRGEEQKLRVDGAAMDVVDSDNRLGTNGVIHAVENVLIPPQAQSLLQSLNEKGRDDILKLIEAANLVSTFEEMENVTFFVPSKEALQNLPKETLRQMEKDSELVKEMLLSHVVTSYVPSSAFTNHQHLETLNNQTVQINLLPGNLSTATIECADITSRDTYACGTVMHDINSVLMPPTGTIMDILRGMEGYDIVATILLDTELEMTLDEEGCSIFLAPIDSAFDQLNDAYMKVLMENKEEAAMFLGMFFFPGSLYPDADTVCCNSMPLYHGMATYHSSLNVRLSMDFAIPLLCKLPASNGFLHLIDIPIVQLDPF